MCGAMAWRETKGKAARHECAEGRLTGRPGTRSGQQYQQHACPVDGPSRRGAASGYADVEELEWGAPGYEETCRRLAGTDLDLVCAADAIYVDQVGTDGCMYASVTG